MSYNVLNREKIGNIIVKSILVFSNRVSMERFLKMHPDSGRVSSKALNVAILGAKTFGVTVDDPSIGTQYRRFVISRSIDK